MNNFYVNDVFLFLNRKLYFVYKGDIYDVIGCIYDVIKKVLNLDNIDIQFKIVYDKWLYVFLNFDKLQLRYIVCVYYL